MIKRVKMERDSNIYIFFFGKSVESRVQRLTAVVASARASSTARPNSDTPVLNTRTAFFGVHRVCNRAALLASYKVQTLS